MEKVRQLIKLGDFFNSFQMLRFNKETEYRTFTGGVVSIGIIITIVIAFASMIRDTVNRTTISYTHNQQKGTPTRSMITASPDNNFMFAISVFGYNLSSENRIFDVVLEQQEGPYGVNYTSTFFPLEPCTKQHWSFIPDVVQNFDSLQGDTWLCPAIGTVYKLQGKMSNDLSNLVISLFPCSNSTDPNRPCASQQAITQYVDQYGYSLFTFYYSNSVINADNPQYKTYYLQDRNYLVFNTKKCAAMDLYLTEVRINSDNSIWPFEDIANDFAYYIPFSPIISIIQIQTNNSFYARYYISKDYATQTYTRQVQKIFVVFSFMGGLIGAIMACLFILNIYTSFSFELALALEVFKGEKDCRTYKKEFYEGFTFNIFHFFKYHFCSFLKKFRKNVHYPFYEHMDQCRNEILSQLDIKNLIKRIIFLEYSISFIFEDYQLAEMHEEKPTLPHEIKKLRRKIQSEMPTKEDELEEDIDKQLRLKTDKIGIFEASKENNNNNSEDNTKIRVRINKPDSILLEDVISENSAANFNQGKKIYIYDQNAQKVQLKKQNLKKLKESAKKGNMVSQKILNAISFQKGENIFQKESQSQN